MLAALLATMALSRTVALPGAVAFAGTISPLDPARFDGVTMVVRYSVAEPDRDDTGFLFLSGEVDAATPPSEVPVLGRGEEAVRLVDSQGDCTLAHVELTSDGDHGEIVYAARTFSGDLKTDVNSEPAAMAISVFRTVRGSGPGDPEVAFRLLGTPLRSAPVCALKDVLGDGPALGHHPDAGQAVTDLGLSAARSGEATNT